ncbi:PucR family transcriptional regulator [Couchioplanes caeruleus]|uniref:Transcriptional regulator n=2 Tax=Couchioplanes caeruleus TaxID=56438 RepID=A0A1K0G3K8_9ACTN|nr:PucR family transcriptional regulator [Couchioplanes caeruleus]OJF11874.1 transcriptional regulator [Couchioplanes caeruleus subsp. caeruleus]ROP34118.1 PucR-like helix-turn-helix protein [Couchioplanes caeruleus]
MDETLPDVRDFRLAEDIVVPLRERLPEVAVQTIGAITATVPAYAEAFAGELGAKIEKAVRAALGTFLNLVSRGAGPDPGSPLAPAIEAAYALGRGEARSGRSLDALLGAYRIGARVAWRQFAAISVSTGQPAPTIARFAELVFAYIDELSAASVAGHADELASSGRARRRRLELLAQALVAGDPPEVVIAAAERAEWAPPQTLTAVLVPERAARSMADLFDARTLHVAEGGPELPETTVLLIPDAQGPSRGHLIRLLSCRGAIVGPARPWLRARDSLTRAIRVSRLDVRAPAGGAVDTEDHLLALVVTADPQALADLRDRVLAPLSSERAATAAKLVETLRSWLLHQGRREDVAAELFVHPQTVRYRMSRLRELYGDRLRDPQWLLMLTVALAAAQAAPS